jgi:glycosyltransferase involved in cell wall biosynthesis
VRVLLVGPSGHGGEEVYVRGLLANPPPGVEYVAAGGFHEGAPGAPCRVAEEVLLNRVLHPVLFPDMGFRSLRIRGHFDLVHVHAHPIRLVGLGSTPLVMSEGSSLAVYLGDYLRWSERRMARRFARARLLYRAFGVHDRLLNLRGVGRAYVFSEWARGINLRWGAEPRKMDVLYPGFEVPVPPARTAHGVFRFLFVGREFERKGGFETLEAFALAAARVPSCRLTIVAPDPALPSPDGAVRGWLADEERRRLLALLTALEHKGLVERHPLQPRAALLERFYPGADAFVMPSRAEGFGFTNVEASSFGLPVLSTRVGAIPEAVRDGETGWLVPPGDVRALADAMVQLAEHPSHARELGMAGRRLFLSLFTRERFAEELGHLYRRAAEAGCAAS